MNVTNVSQENKMLKASYIKNEEVKIDTTKSNVVNDNLNSTKKDELENKKYTEEELEKSIKKLNKFLEDEKVHAEYSVHEDFNILMIKIVEDESEKVVLEIPPEKILDMVASMCKQVGILDEKA